jgi:hypothetical protein
MKKRSDKGNLPRRNFLQGLAGLGGAHMFRAATGSAALEMLVHGAISNLHAESSPIIPRTYVDVFLPGGYSAWNFYLPLDPYPNQTIISNTGCSNNYTGNNFVYSSTPITAAGQTIKLPHIWSSSIPRAASRGGGTVPMSSLLANSLFARGFTEPANSHEFGQIWANKPDPANPSINGMVGDYVNSATTPFPVVVAGNETAGTRAYSAKHTPAKNIGLRTDGNGNPLQALLSSFTIDSSMQQMIARRDVFSQFFQSALQSVANDVKQYKPHGSETLLSSVAGAENLFYRNFGNLTDVYSSLTAKYQDLISRSTGISSILTSAISPASNSLTRRTPGDPATNADLRTIITSNSTVSWLAEGFAVAEFLIQENLSKAINIVLDVGNYTVTDIQIQQAVLPTQTIMHLDHHLVGAGVALPVNTFVAKALAACLYEFTQRLRELNKYDETFIKVGSEFSRAPLINGSGSDHGYLAQCFLGLSGAIHTPYVLGNIKLNADPNGQYAGTMGNAATINHEGNNNTILGIGHHASTICKILRIPSPSPSFQSIVDETSAGIVPVVDPGETRDT